MRYLLAMILAAIVSFGGIYLVTVFVQWDFTHLSEWKTHERGLYLGIGFIGWAAISGLFCSIAEEME